MAVSRRNGTSRPPRWASRLQARVGSGSASPPSGRADEPGPAHGPFCQFGLARLVPAGRRADAARLERRRQGPLDPTSAGPMAAAAPCWERNPKRRPLVRLGLVLLVALGHLPFTTLLRRSHQVADSPDRKSARPLTTLGGVEPKNLSDGPLGRHGAWRAVHRQVRHASRYGADEQAPSDIALQEPGITLRQRLSRPNPGVPAHRVSSPAHRHGVLLVACRVAVWNRMPPRTLARPHLAWARRVLAQRPVARRVGSLGVRLGAGRRPGWRRRARPRR
jgi:hypothetical protein